MAEAHATPAPPRAEERCAALTTRGHRCLNPRLEGSTYCRIHSGRVAEQARLQQQRLQELEAQHPLSTL